MKLRFLKPCGSHNPGDTAEVPESLASKLLWRGIAEKCDEPAALIRFDAVAVLPERPASPPMEGDPHVIEVTETPPPVEVAAIRTAAPAPRTFRRQPPKGM